MYQIWCQIHSIGVTVPLWESCRVFFYLIPVAWHLECKYFSQYPSVYLVVAMWSVVSCNNYCPHCSVSSVPMPRHQELINKIFSWSNKDRTLTVDTGPGRGYTCAPTLSTINTPLPDQVSTSCDHVVTSLTCVPCCCDTLSTSESDTSQPQEEPFGRISQFRPSDSQWERCHEISRIPSACSTGREVCHHVDHW